MTIKNAAIGALFIILGIAIGIAIGIGIGNSKIIRTSTGRPSPLVAHNQNLDLQVLKPTAASTAVDDARNAQTSQRLAGALRKKVDDSLVRLLKSKRTELAAVVDLEKRGRVEDLKLENQLNQPLLLSSLLNDRMLDVDNELLQSAVRQLPNDVDHELSRNLTPLPATANKLNYNRQLNQVKVLNTAKLLNLTVLADLTRQLDSANPLNYEATVDTARVELLG